MPLLLLLALSVFVELAAMDVLDDWLVVWLAVCANKDDDIKLSGGSRDL